MKCCLWLLFKVELIVVQRRAGQGQRQATHNKHIPWSFTCYGSQKTCFTQAEGLCGRICCIFLLMCVQKKIKKLYRLSKGTNRSHPLTKPENSPSSYPRKAKSQSSVTSLCPPTFTAPAIHHHHHSVSLPFLPPLARLGS